MKKKKKRQVNPAGWVIDGCKGIYLKPVAWLWLIFFNTLNVSLLFAGAWSASRSGQDSSSIHNFFFHAKQPASVWQKSKRYPRRLGGKYANTPTIEPPWHLFACTATQNVLRVTGNPTAEIISIRTARMLMARLDLRLWGCNLLFYMNRKAYK